MYYNLTEFTITLCQHLQICLYVVCSRPRNTLNYDCWSLLHMSQNRVANHQGRFLSCYVIEWGKMEKWKNGERCEMGGVGP